jgi:hypothetical protein
VLLYQKKRSPLSVLGCKSRWNFESFSSVITMPPWPCTIGLGMPVVPLL